MKQENLQELERRRDNPTSEEVAQDALDRVIAEIEVKA